MSAELNFRLPVPPSTLGEYVSALLEVFGEAQPAALARMRQIVGDRRAKIILDDEAVEVIFGPGGLEVYPVTQELENSHTGATETATTLALLDGELEVTDAILNGRLQVFGDSEDVIRMFAAIEILLDASPRTPGLQALGSKFRDDRRSRPRAPYPADCVSWYPFRCSAKEIDLLEKLDLLPGPEAETIK